MYSHSVAASEPCNSAEISQHQIDFKNFVEEEPESPSNKDTKADTDESPLASNDKYGIETYNPLK